MKDRISVVVALIAFSALLTGCLSSLPISQEAEETAGGFTLASEVLGQVELKPSSCSAGDRQHFLGADFEDASSGVTVRLVVDPLGDPAVRVFSRAAPFDRSVVFRRGQCSEFHFSLDSTGWRINDVDDYRVTLQLDCTLLGESIRGNVTAPHCH